MTRQAKTREQYLTPRSWAWIAQCTIFETTKIRQARETHQLRSI